jgi:hypothetical protein
MAALTVRDREDLTFQRAQDIVVQATPHPKPITGQDEPLKDFDVLDDTAAAIHAGRIQGALNDIGWHIKRADIETGPVVTVGDCTISVLDHAF